MLIRNYTMPNPLLTQSLSVSDSDSNLFFSEQTLSNSSTILILRDDLTSYFTGEVKLIRGKLAQTYRTYH